MYRRGWISILTILFLFASCATNQSGGPTRRISDLEAYGGVVAEAADRIGEGGDNEAEELLLLSELAVALLARGEEDAAQEALAIGSQRLSRVDDQPAAAARIAARLAEGYGRLERTEEATRHLERARQYAIRVAEPEARADLLVELVLTAARGEGAFAESSRVALDEIFILTDPALRARSILSVARVLAARAVEVDVGNLLQQAIPAAAQVENGYLRGAYYAEISGLFLRLGDQQSARRLEAEAYRSAMNASVAVVQVQELEALSRIVEHFRQRGLIGQAEDLVELIPLEPARALAVARLAFEAQSRGETARAREIASAAASIIQGVRGRPPEVITAQAIIARTYLDLGDAEPGDRVIRRVLTSLADAPATEEYVPPFMQALVYRVERGEEAALGEIVARSDSADFRSRLLIRLADRPELSGEDRLQAGVLRQAAGEETRELSRETQLSLVDSFLSRGLVNEAVRLLEVSDDPYVRAAGYIALLRQAPEQE